MTDREDIVRWWDEANNWGIPIKSEFVDELQRFAALVYGAARERRAFELAECYRCGWDSGVKAEREACARVCEVKRDRLLEWGHGLQVITADKLAKAIQARGEK